MSSAAYNALWEPRRTSPATSLGRVESNFKGFRGLPPVVNMLPVVFGSNLHPENPEKCSRMAQNEPQSVLVPLTFPECSRCGWLSEVGGAAGGCKLYNNQQQQCYLIFISAEPGIDCPAAPAHTRQSRLMTMRQEKENGMSP